MVYKACLLTTRHVLQALNPDAEPDFDEEAELSIVLCSDRHIQELNRQWRNKDVPTDVLSFPQEQDNGVLGDLVISLDTAQRQVSPECSLVFDVVESM